MSKVYHDDLRITQNVKIKVKFSDDYLEDIDIFEENFDLRIVDDALYDSIINNGGRGYEVYDADCTSFKSISDNVRLFDITVYVNSFVTYTWGSDSYSYYEGGWGSYDFGYPELDDSGGILTVDDVDKTKLKSELEASFNDTVEIIDITITPDEDTYYNYTINDYLDQLS